MLRKLFFLSATTAVVSANAQYEYKIMVDGHEAVDLGLSVLWATCNVGATSPEEPGSYYTFNDIDFFLPEIEAENDVATQTMGENWRMPTKDEMRELLKCEWQFDETKKGFFIKNNGKSIFLLNAGFNRSLFNYREGNYWTRTIETDKKMWSLYFSQTYKEVRAVNVGVAQTIRAVCEKPNASKLNYVEKPNANTVYKTIENGKIVIIKNGVKYNLAGQKL